MISPHPRSWLFTPGDRPDRFATARGSGADAMILDWEDAVTAAKKDTARSEVLRWLRQENRGPNVWVRINDRHSRYWGEDLKALAAVGGAPGLAGIVLSKVDSHDDIEDTTGRLGNSGLPIVALIESALGLENATSIAACPSVTALALGSADMRLDAGLGDDLHGWIYPCSRLVFASRAAGLRPPIDGPEMRLDDTDTVRSSALRARGFGFGAKLCLHPSQVPVVNDSFGPDAQTRSRAKRVITAAQSSHGAAVRVDGEMVDRPRLALAHQILARGPNDTEEAP